MGLLRPGPRGELQPASRAFSTSDGVANIFLRKRHRQHLGLAGRSLDQDGVGARDFTAVTMAIDPARLPEAKAMIRKFRDRLCRKLENGHKKEVYIFCQQLFPLTAAQPSKES